MTTNLNFTNYSQTESFKPNGNKPKSSQIHPGPGFRINRQIVRSSQENISRLANYPTPDISDFMNRLYTMDSGIKNLVNEAKIYAPACTVKVFPGDNLMVHKALDIAMPGDVIVVDAGSSFLNGVLGDLISTKAKHRGIKAFVIDGLIRDIDGIKDIGMPVFARGITPIGPLHRGPGEINFPICCGGIVVRPGDVICGDADGLVVVPQESLDELLVRLEKQKETMQTYEKNVRRGEFSNAWVDDILNQLHCE
ncbi:RraA family protein [Tumidithrix elongata RA019]|uniref:Putative 4-hydroxy-4-methyl-2-oxoglutarate aldolase n=1 Tax=Tumidithrix elongata BACA0141 TaxID=2716417 RepID=A0AAW9PZM3_9CYAN|nr:RraA family protein [Tumidithrix elongata RA019]